MAVKHSLHEVKKAFSQIDLSSRGSDAEYVRVTAEESPAISARRQQILDAVRVKCEGLTREEIIQHTEEALAALFQIPRPTPSDEDVYVSLDEIKQLKTAIIQEAQESAAAYCTDGIGVGGWMLDQLIEQLERAHRRGG